MDVTDEITDANNLAAAVRRAVKASGWKESTQKFQCNLLHNIRKLQTEVRNGAYKQSQGTEFRLNENGHIRMIKALCTKDLILQHSLVENVLVPRLRPFLIHDNGASLKGKGISFTRRRFEEHLRRFYREYGLDGYVLKIDFRKFFDNIRHDKLIAAITAKIPDERFKAFLQGLMKSYEIDVSYSEDENIIDEVFNSLEYAKIDRRLLTGKRFMAKSMGIGSPLSQIAGIFFPATIDNYVKSVCRVKFYDVYMDDRIIIHRDKNFLWELLAEIKRQAEGLGLFVNERKTQIVKLSHGFTFLKTRYILTETGKIIRKVPRDVVIRQRRKMKKLAVFAANGELTVEQFKEQYLSWRGDKRRYNAHETLKHMDGLYRRLLKWITQKKNKSGTKNSVFAT